MVEIEKSVLESIGLAVLRSLEQPKDQNSAILLNLCKQQTKFMVLENISQAGGCEIFTDLLGNVDFGGCLNISFLDVDSDERINVDEIEWDADGLIGKAKYEKVAVLNESKEIEERVQFENVLRQAKEDAEKAHRTKSIFLENISQELRSPIDGIIGFIDVLFQTCLDESQKEILRLMQNSSKSMLWILNDIMDAAEIYGGAFTLQNHLFDLYQIIFDVVDVTNLLCVSKDIDLDIVMKGYVPQFVLGDSTRVKQILSNIMTNAAKYSEEGFVKLVVSYSGENGFFNFSVHDSGIGIAQHDTQKIFNSFSGIENNISSRSGNGAGLGLSMCKALAHLMGGSISVSSVLGKGSNFIVQLKLEISDQDLPSTL
jgi:signal transduction histidine kinase